MLPVLLFSFLPKISVDRAAAVSTEDSGVAFSHQWTITPSMKGSVRPVVPLLTVPLTEKSRCALDSCDFSTSHDIFVDGWITKFHACTTSELVVIEERLVERHLKHFREADRLVRGLLSGLL